MKTYEIAFFAMACLMGVITVIGVIVLAKHIAREEQKSDDDATP